MPNWISLCGEVVTHRVEYTCGITWVRICVGARKANYKWRQLHLPKTEQLSSTTSTKLNYSTESCNTTCIEQLKSRIEGGLKPIFCNHWPRKSAITTTVIPHMKYHDQIRLPDEGESYPEGFQNTGRKFESCQRHFFLLSDISGKVQAGVALLLATITDIVHEKEGHCRYYSERVDIQQLSQSLALTD